MVSGLRLDAEKLGFISDTEEVAHTWIIVYSLINCDAQTTVGTVDLGGIRQRLLSYPVTKAIT